MSTGVKKTIVGEVLPNDEDLGRRNCRWRELMEKYSDPAKNQLENSMDIEAAMVMLDQDMSDESSVSDVVEASSEEQSPEENPEEITRQLKVAVPLRKQGWAANGLKEILDDNEFRMLSHEKVENWLRNHMHSISSHYDVHYKTKQVTTVTETRMDADADSLYSVDTAQYIRSNKQTSNKLKVTTMIKQYSVTSSVRRLTSLGFIVDEHKSDPRSGRLSLPTSSTLTKPNRACDVEKVSPQYNAAASRKIAADKHNRRSAVPVIEPTTTDRRKRRKVFKKTIPRNKPSASAGRPLGAGSTSARQRYDPEQVYAKALEQCARMKKTKPVAQRKVSKRFANRMQTISSSSQSDSDEVYFNPFPSRVRSQASSRVKPVPQIANTAASTSKAVTQAPKPPTPNKTSPTEREIVEPFESITLSASKQQPAQPPADPDPAAIKPSKPAKKRVGIQRDGCYHEEGLVIYRPKTVDYDIPITERINLRMEHLNLTGVTKQRHLDKFRLFNYFVHPNSTVCFYPSESSDSDEQNESRKSSKGDISYDDNDPILTFRMRFSNRLDVVEIPNRRPVH
uniref:Uncharacterized protein n=1 Tax=Anopheles minimus TaxID=112268 RepID=A0A182W327_9DIPT